MAGDHAHALYRHGESALHLLPPHVKIVAAVVVVFAVVTTPREAMWAFAVYAAVLALLVAWAGLGLRFVATRMVIEVPFLVFALLLPLVSGGDTVDVLGLSLSREGLWDMWNIVAKATLGLLTSVVLAGTTQIPDIIRGLDTLKMPPVVTAIMGFMIRYLDVVLGELRRMRVAMLSRGHEPRWLGQAGPYARSVGVTFVRSYERGERVYLAMASRGYDGRMPAVAADRAAPPVWGAVALFGLGAWAVALAAWAGQA